MTEPKKRKKRLPKNVEQLTNDEVMRTIFGKRGQEQLKEEANPKDNEQTDVIPTT